MSRIKERSLPKRAPPKTNEVKNLVAVFLVVHHAAVVLTRAVFVIAMEATESARIKSRLHDAIVVTAMLQRVVVARLVLTNRTLCGL